MFMQFSYNIRSINSTPHVNEFPIVNTHYLHLNVSKCAIVDIARHSLGTPVRKRNQEFRNHYRSIWNLVLYVNYYMIT